MDKIWGKFCHFFRMVNDIFNPNSNGSNDSQMDNQPSYVTDIIRLFSDRGSHFDPSFATNILYSSEKIEKIASSHQFQNLINSFLVDKNKDPFFVDYKQKEFFSQIVTSCFEYENFCSSISSFISQLPKFIATSPYDEIFMKLLLSPNAANVPFQPQHAKEIFDQTNNDHRITLSKISMILQYASYSPSPLKEQIFSSFANTADRIFKIICDNTTNSIKHYAFNVLFSLQNHLSQDQKTNFSRALCEGFDRFTQPIQTYVLKFVTSFVPHNFVDLIFSPSTNSALNSQIIKNLTTDSPSNRSLLETHAEEIIARLEEYSSNSGSNRFNPFIADLGQLFFERLNPQISNNTIPNSIRQRIANRKMEYAKAFRQSQIPADNFFILFNPRTTQRHPEGMTTIIKGFWVSDTSDSSSDEENFDDDELI